MIYSLDLFREIRSMEMVKKVSYLNPNLAEKGPINLIFFSCPKMSSQGFRLNSAKTGYTAEYLEGFSKGSLEKIGRACQFIDKFKELGVKFEAKCVFAAADAVLLFPIPVRPPVEIPSLESIEVVSNLNQVISKINCFSKFYHEEPWQVIPLRNWQGEIMRLKEMLPESPENIKQDFVNRVLAGFALDGLLIKEGIFGPNPVILGIESPGVAVLQNAALTSLGRENWLPIVQL